MADLSSKEVVFVLGGPGSGKGTQSQNIAKEYGIGYLSTGDLLRAATSEADEALEGDKLDLVVTLRDKMKNGELVPDEIILQLVKEEMAKQEAKYFFLDGFPRTVAQAEKFTEQIGECKAVLFLEVSDDELTSRLLKRGETSGRTDDNLDAIKKRLETYHNASFPVIEMYEPKGKVIKINGLRSIDAVRADILAELRKFWEIPVHEGEPQQVPEGETQAEKVAEKVSSKCCNLI